MVTFAQRIIFIFMFLLILLPIMNADFGYNTIEQNNTFGYNTEEPVSVVTFLNYTNTTEYWKTTDGILNNVQDIPHNHLGGLQGGHPGEYYHINLTWYNELVLDILNWVTGTEANQSMNVYNTSIANLLSGSYVPYTGATTDVDLGVFDFTARDGNFTRDLEVYDDLKVYDYTYLYGALDVYGLTDFLNNVDFYDEIDFYDSVDFHSDAFFNTSILLQRTGDAILEINTLSNNGSAELRMNADGTNDLYIYTYGSNTLGNLYGLPKAGSSYVDAQGERLVIGTFDSSPMYLATSQDPRFILTAGGDLIPYDDETYDIGNTSNRLRDLYILGENGQGGIRFVEDDGTYGNLSMDDSFNLLWNGNIITNINGTFIGNSSIWSRAGTNTFLTNIGDRVGIGTASPKHLLDVGGMEGIGAPGNLGIKSDSGALAIRIEENSGVEGWHIGVNADGDLNFDDSNTGIRLTFQDETGNVGIGTTNPAKSLEIYSSSPILRIRDSGLTASATTSYIEFGGTNATAVWNRTGYVGDGSSGNADISLVAEVGDLHLGDSSGVSVLNLQAGKVGIGTTSPDNKLEVESAVEGDGITITTTNVNHGGFLRLNYPLGGTTRNWGLTTNYGTTGDFEIRQSNAGDGDPDTAGTTRFTILDGGNVGIGTTSPDFKLQVDGDIVSETTGTDSLGSSLIKWLKGWFVNLDVLNNAVIGGDLNVTGNITSPNTFIPQYIFSHTNKTIPLIAVNTWTNVSFDQEDADIKFGITHTYNDATNHTFTVSESGVYDLDYNFDAIDTSPSASDIDLAGRVIYKDGTEIDGSVFELDIIKQGFEVELSHNFLVRLNAGDIVIFQFIASDGNVVLSTHGIFGNHPESASVVIKKVANL